VKRQLILGAAGSGISHDTLRSVREQFGDRVFVVAIDINPRERVAASVMADAFVQVPLARSTAFLPALAELAEAYPGSCYLPVHDEELAAVADLATAGRLPPGLDVIAPSPEVIRICNDKWLAHQWLQDNGFDTAKTALADPVAVELVGLPAILKPRSGTASTGVRLIHDAAELAGLDREKWLLQELFQSQEITAEGLLSRRDGNFRTYCRLQLAPMVGYRVIRGVWRVLSDPAVGAIVERLARQLPLPGAFIVQGFHKDSSPLLITDINPRVASGMRAAAAVGTDFLAANLADFWGEPIDQMAKPVVGEHVVARGYSEHVTASTDPMLVGISSVSAR
jgi:carbamoyl-phosphate synthase large subunit